MESNKEEIKKEENREDKPKQEEIEKKEEIVKQQEIEEKTEETVKEKKIKANQTTEKASCSDTTVKKDNTPKTTSKPKAQPKTTMKTTTATESIPFKTVKKNDSSLEKGKTKVIQEGKNGVRTITYKETYTNGKLTKKEQTGSKVTTQPVDKIIAVGTKAPAPEYLSASQAHSILGGSGMSKSGSQYSLNVGSYGQTVRTTVGGNHITSIYFNPTGYMPYKYVTKQELIDALGKEQGEKEYAAAQQIVKQVEKAVRASANAVYGAGTSKANQLYNEIINAKSPVSKSF